MTPVRLLVADDSAVARAKLRKLFEGAGYEVTLAADGEEALELIGKQSFSLLITDLEMPKLDGFQVIASVKGSLETEDMPIIAITGHEELSARVNDCQGLYGIFKKPWNDRELLKRVAAVSTLRRPAAAS
jgi:CheY-like chemotaxis protein